MSVKFHGWKSMLSRRTLLAAGAGAAGAAVAGALTGPESADAVTFNEPLTVDFGPPGSLTVGTPLGNGPGLILMAPNGNRRDITGWIGGLQLGASTTADAPSTIGLIVNEGGQVGVQTWDIGPEYSLQVAGSAYATQQWVSGGGDASELFAVKTSAEPGSVMIMTDDGELEPCSIEYDQRVAGVVSGAGGLHPGIMLNGGPREGHQPIALVGRAYCMVDADRKAVRVGDLLTTSATPGHAMVAADRSRAHGVVIGKALAPLDHGTGLIPVLVSLQ
jgi:hypothetical protein